MNETPYEFIRLRIEQAFLDLAEQEGANATDPDDIDGQPLELFHAQSYLLGAWEKYLQERS